MRRRSALFTPGDEPERIRKAATTDADVLLFDLEDAVATDAKDSARATVASVLDSLDAGDSEVAVRVNPLDAGGDEDAAAAAAAGADALMVPKVDGPATLDAVRSVAPDVPLFALVETARGVLHAPAIADADGVAAVAFGAEDYAVDVGASPTLGGDELCYARQRLVTAAAAAGADALDAVFTDLGNADGLRDATSRARALGFDGKLVVHPAQVSVVNEAFAPSPERVAWAQRVLTAADSGGGVVRVDGEMVDAPRVERARRILADADADE
ncbi:MAG: CoA ester lyase [Halanaeroarchaeum sp.]